MMPAFNLRGHTGPVMCLECSPNNTHLASGSTTGEVFVWRISSRRRTHCAVVTAKVDPMPHNTEDVEPDEDTPSKRKGSNAASILTIAWLSEEGLAVQSRDHIVHGFRVPFDSPSPEEGHLLEPVWSRAFTSYSFCKIVYSPPKHTLFIPTHEGGMEIWSFQDINGTKIKEDEATLTVACPSGLVRTGSLMFLHVFGGMVLAGYESGHLLRYSLLTNEWISEAMKLSEE
eukprot:PhF_6_TR33572/c1_g1_i2/m.48987